MTYIVPRAFGEPTGAADGAQAEVKCRPGGELNVSDTKMLPARLKVSTPVHRSDRRAGFNMQVAAS